MKFVYCSTVDVALCVSCEIIYTNSFLSFYIDCVCAKSTNVVVFSLTYMFIAHVHKRQSLLVCVEEVCMYSSTSCSNPVGLSEVCACVYSCPECS